MLLLGGYHVVRLAAGRCAGPQCDAYIPLSLLVPILVVVMVAVTGALAIRDARAHDRRWSVPLIASTVLGTAGPVVAAAVFRDQPDMVVVVATVLFLQAPLLALAYTLRSRSSRVL
ncbi:MAG TPA: hypothetical protein VNF26_14290 [Candidatus Baltobacterales bacterium]|nr:hypothetical protein [Candidatus Baltobacterales bacterium]